MHTPVKFSDIDKVLAEADRLVERISLMVSENVIETGQIEGEKRLKALESISTEMQDKISKEATPKDSSSYAEGFHEAYQDIVKAMKNLKELLN